MKPHQQRVVDEKAELDDKLSKLVAFIDSSPIFADLPFDEKVRLVDQKGAMEHYSDILRSRIAAFPDHEPA